MKKTIIFFVLIACFSTQAQRQRDNAFPALSLDSFTAKIKRHASPQIVDARSAEEFALNHADGAVNINPGAANAEEVIKGLQKDQPVFIYSIGTGRSGQLAADLRKRGFKEVYELKGGIANWVGGGQQYFTTASKSLSLQQYNRIIASNKLVLADIGSRYCGACKKVKPLLDSLRRENGDALTIVEIDLEESPELITALKTVDAFPYLILYRQGEIVVKRSGLEALKQELDKALAKAK